MAKEVRKLYYGLSKKENPDLETVKSFELEADFTVKSEWITEAIAKAGFLAVQDISEGPDNPRQGETVYYNINVKEPDAEGNLYVRWEHDLSLTRGIDNSSYSVD